MQSYLSLVTEIGSRFAGSKAELISGVLSSAVKFCRMISSVFCFFCNSCFSRTVAACSDSRFSILFWIFSRFAIFNYFTAEPVRITVLLNDFLCAQLTVELCYFLINRFNRSINVRNMLLEIFIIQQVIFGKIVEGAGCFF